MAHPSTKTNNNNLNGSEISIGDSIIMPKDMRIDAITISITRKGKNIKNPISKAVFNSDVMKDGKTIESGMACVSSNGPSPAISANIFIVSDRVFATINSFNKSVAMDKATCADFVPSKYGLTQSHIRRRKLGS